MAVSALLSPAISLTVDTSAITAIGNDYGFEHIFSRQLEGIGNKGAWKIVSNRAKKFRDNDFSFQSLSEVFTSSGVNIPPNVEKIFNIQ